MQFLYKWTLNKVAGWVARYPRVALGVVVGYVVLSFFEIIPIVEVISDFIVILGYVLIRLYIAERQHSGRPVA
jgi:hypothetical protein